jgi:hypothetical protein
MTTCTLELQNLQRVTESFFDSVKNKFGECDELVFCSDCKNLFLLFLWREGEQLPFLNGVSEWD